MDHIVYPDYDKSILNLINSILHHYGADTHHPTLKTLDAKLAGNASNIVLMVFDGMGVDLLRNSLAPDSLLRTHFLESVKSVYPCTTTAAMTTFYSGLSPLEHGWLGWSLYFKEYGRTIDTFLNKDSFTGEIIGEKRAADLLLPFEDIFSKITDATDSRTTTHMVNPRGILVADESTDNVQVDSLAELCQRTLELTQKGGKRFIMTYWPDPDMTTHIHGCHAETTQASIHEINEALKAIIPEARDTLFIITADHGLTDIHDTIQLDEYPEIARTLIMPPFMEPRCSSFYVKKGKEDRFETLFKEAFHDHFILYSKADFLNPVISVPVKPI